MQVVADVRTKAGGNDKPFWIHPHDTADCGNVGLKFVQDTIPILIGYRTGGRQGQSDSLFATDQAAQERLEILPDCTGEFQIGLHLRLFARLIPFVEGEGLEKEKRDKNNKEEEKDPLPDPHCRPNAKWIVHRCLVTGYFGNLQGPEFAVACSSGRDRYMVAECINDGNDDVQPMDFSFHYRQTDYSSCVNEFHESNKHGQETTFLH